MRMLFFDRQGRLSQFSRILALIFFLICLPAAVSAQSSPNDFKATLSGWQTALDKMAARLSRGISTTASMKNCAPD
jgi:hypothetical protein